MDSEGGNLYQKLTKQITKSLRKDKNKHIIIT